MADRDLHNQDQVSLDGDAPSTQHDYFTILTNIISEVSQDPSQVRKLVYALAWLKTDELLSLPAQGDTKHIEMLSKLKHKLELEEAIDRIEAIIQDEPHKLTAGQTASGASGQSEILIDDDESIKHSPRDLDELSRSQRQSSERSDGSTELAVILPPAQAPIRLPQLHGMLLDQIPPWLERIRSTLHRLEYEPKEKSFWIRPGLLSFLQLTAAVVFGVALYIGVAGWVQIGRQTVPGSTQPSAVSGNASSPAASHVAGGTSPSTTPLPPKPELPFPLPTSFGIYAVDGDKLIELTKLPFKIPDPRIRVSAEISEPSQAVVASGNVSFVVFRRDLVNSAPSTATVRVIARVKREMKFVDGKPTYTALPHSWRIRDKSFDFNVSPLAGRPEMILIRPAPGVDLPAGRYALDLLAQGYDFTVAGEITSPDQCLEQVQVLNGSVLAPCSKS